MKKLAAPWLAIEAVLALALLFFGFFLNLGNTRQLHRDSEWVIHTRQVMSAVSTLELRLSEAESSQRGFVITGDRSYFDHYSTAAHEANSQVDAIEQLTRDNPSQYARVGPLRQHVQARLEQLRLIGELRQSQNIAQLSQSNLAAQAREEIAQVHNLIAQMVASEQALLDERSRRSEASFRTAVFAATVTGAAGLISVGALILLMIMFGYSREKSNSQIVEQKDRLRTILASIGDAVIVTDEHACVTNMNPVAEYLTGWTFSDAAGQPLHRVFQIVNQDTREPVENPAARALRDGVVVGLANHTVLIAKDGQERPIDDSAAPVKDDLGNVSGTVLVFRDVTERRAIEKEQAELASIVADSDDAIVSKTLEGIIVSWNSGAERLFGYSAAEAIGQSINLIVPEDLRQEERSILEKLKRGERIAHFETTRVRKDGQKVEISLTISPLRDRHGRITGAAKVARDITESKRGAADTRFLAEASASLAGLVDSRTALQTVANLAVPSFADWCAVDMLGPDGMLERVAVAHVDPAKVELAYELQRRFPTDPDQPQGTLRIIRTGQSEIVAEITDEMLEATVPDLDMRQVIRDLGLVSYMGVPVQVRGSVLGVITFIAAESDRRYNERDLSVAEDLAHRAAVAVDNARLYAELKEVDDRKNRFLATLAHELRNPLAPMLYSLELAKSVGSDSESIPLAHQTIGRQLTHLVRLVDDLLDVSRITRDKIELRRATVELASVVHQAVETVRPLAEDKGATVQIRLPEEPIYLDADPTRIAQVFTNLLNNACKFSERGGRVSLSAEVDSDEIVVTVADGGIGIAPEMLSSIFEMFVQSDTSLEGSKGGLGIGLTLVRRLTELHGGSVTATSEGLNKGSEFSVRLPLSHQEPASAAIAHPSPEASPATNGKVRRVLVVDDNRDAAEVLSMLLTLDGHTAYVAHDGAAAVQAAEEYRPELVLLDIGLPIMSGFDVARAIRTQDWGKHTMLVAITGWGQDQDRQKSKEAGFDSHLVKPIGRRDLAALFEELLRTEGP